MHEFHEFPKWKYHAEKEAVIVDHKDAETALGSGWVDSPAELQEDWAPKEEASLPPAPAAPPALTVVSPVIPMGSPKKVIRRAKA